MTYRGLCVGGPHDRCDIEAQSPTMKVPVARGQILGGTAMVVDHTVYQWCDLHVPDAEPHAFAIWKPVDMTFAEAMGRLFSAYRPG